MPAPRAVVILLTVAQTPLLSSCSSSTAAPPLSVDWASLSVGAAHVCGLGTDGGVYCWGSNRHGQLGIGPGTVSTARVSPVSGPALFQLVGAGSEHTCAVATDGAAYCWGADEAGQLGVGREKDGLCAGGLLNQFPCATTPTAVAGGLLFTTLSTGLFHTCGLTPAGAAWCWGMNAWGQLGTTNVPDTCGSTRYPCSATPVRVTGDLHFRDLTAGGFHTCGLTDDGVAYCWGSNQYGELGSAVTVTCGANAAPCSAAPVQVGGSAVWVRLTAGFGHTCGVASDGQAYCWGWSEAGQLGTSASEGSCPSGPCISQPTPVSAEATLIGLTAGERHTCGLASGGAGYCWGFGEDGELGTHSMTSSPLPVAVVNGVVFLQISAGGRNTCAVAVDQKAYCWGDNSSGQLGRSDVTATTIPLQVNGK